MKDYVHGGRVPRCVKYDFRLNRSNDFARVTATDKSNEDLIRRGLHEAFPEDRFLGEVHPCCRDRDATSTDGYPARESVATRCISCLTTFLTVAVDKERVSRQ